MVNQCFFCIINKIIGAITLPGKSDKFAIDGSVAVIDNPTVIGTNRAIINSYVFMSVVINSIIIGTKTLLQYMVEPFNIFLRVFYSTNHGFVLFFFFVFFATCK